MHRVGDRASGRCVAGCWNIFCGKRRCCSCCSWITLRPRTRRGIWCRNVIAGLVAFLVFDLLLTQLSRLDVSTKSTWFDLGWYGFMPTRQYRSFAHASPAVEFLQADERCSRDPIVFAPRGAAVSEPGGIILDHTGELVWRHSGFKGDTQDLRVQEYRGEKFLTFWVDEQINGSKKGVWYMMDDTYTVRHQIRCKGSCDMHEFQITQNHTALLAVYGQTKADLTAIGSLASGWLLDCKFQEVDIETGELLFEWTASDHFAAEDSYRTIEHCSSDPGLVFDGCGYYESSAFDFYHINSLQKDDDGNYLVSARNTHTISYVDGRTGDVLWTLGGKRNNFTDLSDGAATNFAWQHHARWLNPSTISLFDNAYSDWRGPQDLESRGMIVDLDLEARTAALRMQYVHPSGMQSQSQGNTQVLDGGNVFVGWGRCAAFSEFAPDGKLLCDAHFGASAFYSFGPVSSYRVFREAWTGRPKEPPSVVVDGDSLFVSWNGATEATSWRIDGATLEETDDDEEDISEEDWDTVLQVRKTGFETEIFLPQGATYKTLRVVGLESSGAVLGASEPLEWPDENWPASPLVHLIVSGVALLVGITLSVAALIAWRRGQSLSWQRCGRKRQGYRLLKEEEEQ